MFARRTVYLALVLGLLSYYIAAGTWLSWILLLAVLGVPWFSLLVSLPAIRQFRLSTTGADTVQLGDRVHLWLLGSCPMPMPPFRGDIRLKSCLTGEVFRYSPDKGFSPAHCGGYRAAVEKARVYDYMKLFSFRCRKVRDDMVVVRPRPVPITDAPVPESSDANNWIPKHGGGFSENHELRPYRPGDSLNQIHWKLSAKTGDLILREPMEAVRSRTLLTMDLSGTAEELDRKLGRFLWMGDYLLEKNFIFDLRVLTAEGILSYSVEHREDLLHTLDTLLCSGPAKEGSIRERAFDAGWQYHIGGRADENG